MRLGLKSKLVAAVTVLCVLGLTAITDKAEALAPGMGKKFLCLLPTLSFSWSAFWAHNTIFVVVFFAAAWSCGRGVVECRWPVAYTRKLFGSICLIAPAAIFWASTEVFSNRLNQSCRVHGQSFIRYSTTDHVSALLISSLIVLLCFLAFMRPIRERAPFLDTAFKAIDRPGDRPFTLTWLVTSFVVTEAIIIGVYWAAAQHWGSPRLPQLMLIAIIVSCIGDALAEPIGVRFGRHSYATRALFTSKTYVRTLEGSACVFLSAVLGVAMVASTMSSLEFGLALAAFPSALTLAEAKSPHTWDQPFIFAVWAIVALGFLQVSSLLA